MMKQQDNHQQLESKNVPGIEEKIDEQLDPIQYRILRGKKIQELKESGPHPYPHKFLKSMEIEEFITKYKHLTNSQVDENTVAMAGRLTRVASSGANLRFYDMESMGFKIQVLANAKYHKMDEQPENESFTQVHGRFKRGDIIGVIGYPSRSQRGELSIIPKTMQILSPCLHLLPEANNLKDTEIRYRQRYLDLLINDSAKKVFTQRSKIIAYLRSYFENRGFLEVETPILNQLVGGAAAKPFKTYHNHLNLNMVLRIAPELWLKTLVVGGMDRVFEIGKNFRNEGLDMTHNPEFTAMEAYWAYADINDLIEMTEDLLSKLAMRIHGSYQFEYQPAGSANSVMLDFEPPFARLSLIDEIESSTKIKLPRPLTSPECQKVMAELIIKEGLELPKPPTAAKMIDMLCTRFVEVKAKTKPTFIMDHPQFMSPLAKWHRSKPEMSERAELFILGYEVANFYTELNDPFLQRRFFEEQLEARKMGDDEAADLDEDFCLAMEHGLPPTGGWGLGIDRLVMFLTNKNTIKESILFPAMKPKPDDKKPSV